MPLLIDLVGSAADLPTPLAATTALAVPAGLPTKALQDSLLLLSLLTANQPELQRDFGDMGGVGVVLPLLAPQADTRLMLAAVDCLWSAAVPCEANVRLFVERDGTLRLFECLAGCAFAPRAQLLSFAADMLSHREAAEQADGWNAKGHASAVALLLQLWSEEEARRGAAAAAGSLINSTARPLSTARGEVLQDFSASLHLEGDEGDALDDDELEEERAAMVRELNRSAAGGEGGGGGGKAGGPSTSSSESSSSSSGDGPREGKK